MPIFLKPIPSLYMIISTEEQTEDLQNMSYINCITFIGAATNGHLFSFLSRFVSFQVSDGYKATKYQLESKAEENYHQEENKHDKRSN